MPPLSRTGSLVSSAPIWGPEQGIEGQPPKEGRCRQHGLTLRRWGHMPRAARGGKAAPWSIIVALWACSLALGLVALSGIEPAHESIRVPWWMLALAFGLAETWVVHLHFRSETTSFSLFELPLVFGLIFTAPQEVWAATILGTGLSLIVVRRQPAIKVAFNVANLSFHASLAALIAHQFIANDPLAPRSWFVLAGSTMVGGAIQILALGGIITVSEGTLRRRQLAGMLASGLIISAANTAQALIGAILLQAERTSVGLLLAPVVALLLAYRAYVAERNNREQVEFLHSSTKALRENPEITTAAAALLSEATSMFRAERADLIFFTGEESNVVTHFRHENGATVGEAVDDADHQNELRRLVSATRIVDRPVELEHLEELLGATKFRDAIVGSLEGAKRDVGALIVTNRLGTVTSFNEEDLRLFETLVQQAAIALENDQLEQAISEMRRLERHLAHQATHDGLTGLVNRTLLGERLEAALAEVGRRVSVLYVDLDDFKVVNDTLGHQAGDQVLVEVSRRINNVVRPSDTVSRLGGDEFAVLLPHSEQPAIVARRIIQALHEPILYAEHDILIGASVGLATADEHSSASLLLNDADLAMYAAKGNGKGAVVEFHSSMRDDITNRRRIRTQLRTAIEDDEFEVVYQPIVDLASGGIEGAEALVRWNSGEGLRMPATFIGEAERAGLITSIDRNVLSKVLSTLTDLDEHEPSFVSVNLSARNFQDDDLADHFARSLMSTGVAPTRLVVEITETALLRDPDRTVGILSDLREMGLRVALDDFGTGFSSLSYLRRLPVDILKIAQPFVADVEEDDTFVRAMIDLGKTLGLQIVAEGVETAGQRDVLLELGCDLVQGYLFGVPATTAELVATIDAARPGPATP